MLLAYFAAPQLHATAAGINGSSAEGRPLTGAEAPTGVKSASASSAPSVPRSLPVLSAGWLAFWEGLMYVMMRRTFYPEFVVKMLVLFPLLAAILIAAINVNRRVWSSVHKQQQHIAGNTAAAHGGMSPILPGGGRR
jgi:hypothetical protein